MNEIAKWLEEMATKLEESTDEKIQFRIGDCESECYIGDGKHTTIKGALFMTINNGNLFTLVDKKQDITDYFDIFDNNAIIDIDEEYFTYIDLPYKISLNQIKFDIDTLKNEFEQFSGAWEYNDGDYGCISIAENELALCKGISNRYPFEYKYDPSEFDKNPNDLSEDWSNIKFDINDFNTNNVNKENYNKVDAVAFDFQEELIGMVDQLKTELEWLPPRFRAEFVEIICQCDQDRHSVRKNCEFFTDDIMSELTEEEDSQMFIRLGVKE